MAEEAPLYVRPKGPKFLSPGQRPGTASNHSIVRPERPRYCTPVISHFQCWHLSLTAYPVRWAGLRERGPLGRLTITTPYPSRRMDLEIRPFFKAGF